MDERTESSPTPSGQAVSWFGFEAGGRPFRVAATDKGACRLSLPGEDAGAFFRWLAVRFRRARLVEDPARLEAYASVVRACLRGEGGEPVPLDPIGTPFQRAVWEIVVGIPRGTTVAYGEIAKRLGFPQASRAVGAAVAANPLPLFIPTHRVVASDGSVPGYGPSVPIKEELLRLEGILPRGRGEKAASAGAEVPTAP
ncbi:MAG TPA: methylated-DNA--[protein]-cysteine S-methyltransferase [Planctomycetota bacterium]|nr:methylated-DNA--[protein]-cysteine S-methyltransferase [Planctomycetota bacterium]